MIASAQIEPAPELDVPTAAGVEEPAPVEVKVEVKPETGWRAWISWVQGFVRKIIAR